VENREEQQPMARQSKTPSRVGLIVNEQKPGAISVAREAVRLLEGHVAEIALSRSLAATLDLQEYASDEERITSTDAVLVFGGDGTVLATSRICAPLGTPMMGVNLGRFGFLNDVAPESLESALSNLLTGDYTIEERLMIRADIVRNGASHFSAIALNEVVISHGSFLRVLQLSLSINGKYVTTYAADGVIIATPTGSTAYSLSAGGPLVHPDLATILITPICAHTLTTRALVVPSAHEISVLVENSEEDGTRVTLDGQLVLPTVADDKIVVRSTAHPARLIVPHQSVTFYNKLQSKLRWGERVAY
jgi:NAD+ kinase